MLHISIPLQLSEEVSPRCGQLLRGAPAPRPHLLRALPRTFPQVTPGDAGKRRDGGGVKSFSRIWDALAGPAKPRGRGTRWGCPRLCAPRAGSEGAAGWGSPTARDKLPLTRRCLSSLAGAAEMPGRRLWWARCWLGVCLSLLGAGGGSPEPCRGPPCGGGEAVPPPCRGARCGGRAGRPARSFLHTATPLRPPQGKAPPAAPQAAPHPAGRGGAAEACPGGACATNGTRRDCQGLECRLPPRLRPRPRGPGCAAPGEGCPEPALLRAAERAAQFAGDDFAYAGPELGGGALGVQLTCDVKPGAGRPEGAGRAGGSPPGRWAPRAGALPGSPQGRGGLAWVSGSRRRRGAESPHAWRESDEPRGLSTSGCLVGTPDPLILGGESGTGLCDAWGNCCPGVSPLISPPHTHVHMGDPQQIKCGKTFFSTVFKQALRPLTLFLFLVWYSWGFYFIGTLYKASVECVGSIPRMNGLVPLVGNLLLRTNCLAVIASKKKNPKKLQSPS